MLIFWICFCSFMTAIITHALTRVYAPRPDRIITSIVYRDNFRHEVYNFRLDKLVSLDLLRQYPSEYIVRKLAQEYAHELAEFIVKSGAIRVDVYDNYESNWPPSKTITMLLDIIPPGAHKYDHQVPFKSFEELAERLKDRLYDNGRFY